MVHRHVLTLHRILCNVCPCRAGGVANDELFYDESPFLYIYNFLAILFFLLLVMYIMNSISLPFICCLPQIPLSHFYLSLLFILFLKFLFLCPLSVFHYFLSSSIYYCLDIHISTLSFPFQHLSRYSYNSYSSLFHLPFIISSLSLLILII